MGGWGGERRRPCLGLRIWGFRVQASCNFSYCLMQNPSYSSGDYRNRYLAPSKEASVKGFQAFEFRVAGLCVIGL